jgi:hypothetical protein
VNLEALGVFLCFPSLIVKGLLLILLSLGVYSFKTINMKPF